VARHRERFLRDCLGESFSAAAISLAGGPGRYRLEYRLGDELLASGGFEIVAPGGAGAEPSASPQPATGRPPTASTGTAIPAATPGGTIRFGTGPGSDACTVAGETASFTIGQPVHVAADLGHTIPVGEEVRIAVRYGGAEIAADTTTVSEATSCLDGSLPTTGLPAGRYAVEYSLGSGVLASGEFELVP
jgi:hypothetical protein